MISPVTGRLEPHYPSWKQNLFFYFVSLPTIIMCLLVVFYIMLVIFELQEWINDLVQRETVPSWVYFVPKILLAIVISGLDEVYKKIAIWLNDKGNLYETVSVQTSVKFACKVTCTKHFKHELQSNLFLRLFVQNTLSTKFQSNLFIR